MLGQDGIIKGELYDQKDETIPFATVSVMKLPDSTLITGTTTDIDGNFKLKPSYTGTYMLKFSAIGYKPSYTRGFEITGPGFTKDIGEVVMNEEATMLNEVLVKTWRPRVEVDNGNMVMRVEGTAIASGNTAFDMLSRAPGVSVNQNGEFRINGKQGVAVMIDGRLSYLSGTELQALLEGMPAENIKNIEVINNPSAKYDAEGAAGILNINLKKNSLAGVNGSIYAGFKYNEQQLLNGGLNLNYKKDKWNSFLNLDVAERGMIRDQEISRTFPVEDGLKGFEQIGTDERKRLIPSLQLGTDYDINERHSVGGVFNFTYQDRVGDWDTYSRLTDAENNNIANIEANNHNNEEYATGRLNFHYVGELDTVGTTISADLDYVRLKKESDSRFRNFFTYPDDTPNSLENLFSESDSDYDIYSAKVDFSTPLSETSNLELGVKTSKVISDSELKYFREVNGDRVLDPSISDKFRYEEEIYAAYASYSNRFNDTWNLKLGLRAEQTKGKGGSFSMNEVNDKDYLELFPNFSLEQKVSENYKLNYSYSRRITRPDYERLNPVIFYLDPYTYVVGNPGLKSQINNTFQVSQTFFKKYHLMLSYDNTVNYMAEVPSTNPETRETSLSQRNIESFKSYSATIVAPFELTSFWKMNNNLVFNQQDYDFEIDGESIHNDNLFYMLQSNHQINLPADIKMELNATFRGPMAYGIYNIDEQWWLDLGFRKSFMDDKLSVSLNATDVFKTMDMHVDAEYSGNRFVLDQYFGNQAVSLSLRYNFSKGSKAERKTRQNNLEELNRAGG
ncbi:TonB-dependent receptor domain-containing protein [Salegentibacter chungangensis]|uniref:TonB-dependent receptor domain-containing protein n=1 Tax=Salegentibacter chungangensis TaxID=1335724 RepID=A0ABW3NN26_9FLAO